MNQEESSTHDNATIPLFFTVSYNPKETEWVEQPTAVRFWPSSHYVKGSRQSVASHQYHGVIAKENLVSSLLQGYIGRPVARVIIKSALAY